MTMTKTGATRKEIWERLRQEHGKNDLVELLMTEDHFLTDTRIYVDTLVRYKHEHTEEWGPWHDVALIALANVYGVGLEARKVETEKEGIDIWLGE